MYNASCISLQNVVIMFAFMGQLYILILHFFTDQKLLHKDLDFVLYTVDCIITGTLHENQQ